jgi:hypothetical protein
LYSNCTNASPSTIALPELRTTSLTVIWVRESCVTVYAAPLGSK